MGNFAMPVWQDQEEEERRRREEAMPAAPLVTTGESAAPPELPEAAPPPPPVPNADPTPTSLGEDDEDIGAKPVPEQSSPKPMLNYRAQAPSPDWREGRPGLIDRSNEPAPVQEDPAPPTPAPAAPIKIPTPTSPTQYDEGGDEMPSANDQFQQNQATKSARPAPGDIGHGPQQQAYARDLAAYRTKAEEKTPRWKNIVGNILMGLGQQPAGDQLMGGKKLREMRAGLAVDEKAAEEERLAESAGVTAGLTRQQRETSRAQQDSLTETRLMTAEARKLNAQANVERIQNMQSERNRAYLLKRLGSRVEDSQYQEESASRPDGYEFVADPEHPGQGYATPPAWGPAPKDLLAWLPGIKEGEMITHSERRKAQDAAQKGHVAEVTAGGRAVTENPNVWRAKANDPKLPPEERAHYQKLLDDSKSDQKSSVTHGSFNAELDELGEIKGYYNPLTDERKPAGFQGGRKTGVAPSEVEKRANLENTIKFGHRLEELGKKYSQYIGRFSGELTDLQRKNLGVDAEGVNDMYRISRNLADLLARARTGAAASYPEMLRLYDLMPNPASPLPKFNSDLKIFLQEATSLYKGKTGRAAPTTSMEFGDSSSSSGGGVPQVGHQFGSGKVVGVRVK